MHIFFTFSPKTTIPESIKLKKCFKIAEIRVKIKRTALTVFEKTKNKKRETVSLAAIKPNAAPAKTNARG